MKKLVKLITLITIIVIALLVTAIGLLNLYLTPEKLNSIISKQVSAHSNMTLNIQGKTKWSFYPHISLNVSDAELNRNTADHINIGNINIGVKLLPLLSKHIEPTGLTLKDIEYTDSENNKITLAIAKLNVSRFTLDQAFPLDLFLRIKNGQSIANIQLLADTTITSDLNHIKLSHYKLNINKQMIAGDLSISRFNGSTQKRPFLHSLNIKGNANSDLLTLQNIQRFVDFL